MIRLFVALEIPAEVRERLSHLKGGVPGARWLPPEQLHLTLRFIGDVAENVAADVRTELARVKAEPFDFTVDGTGCFGEGRKARVLWAGIEANEALNHLQKKVEIAVEHAGLEPETRKFTPHVTLARLRHPKPDRVRDWLESNSTFRADPIRADRFTLFSSFLSSEGALHTPEESYALNSLT